MVNAGLTVRVIVADAKLLPVSVARNVMLLAPDAVGVRGVWVNGRQVADEDGLVEEVQLAGRLLTEFAA